MLRDSTVILAAIFLLLLKLSLANREYLLYFIDTYQNKLLIMSILNILVYRYILKSMMLNLLYQETIMKIETHIASLYYILLVGAIGSRKSANLTAFAQMCEMSKIRRMHENQYKTQVLLGKVIDFNDFATHIQETLDPSLVHHDFDYKNIVYKFFKKNASILQLTEHVPFESFRTPTILQILAEYVEVYYYLYIRKVHIMSNTTIESVNTGYNSLPVKESYFQLYRSNDLAHEKYLVIVEDEKGVVDNSRVYARMDKDSVKDNDDGKDIHAMLQRHGSKGTNTTLVVSQSEKDVTANRRRLPNRFVEFIKPSNVHIFDIEMRLLNWIIGRIKQKEHKFYKRKMRQYNRNLKAYSLRNKEKYYHKAEMLYHDYHNYLDTFNTHKQKIKKFEKLSLFLGKFLYLVQPIFLHESEEHIGTRNENENKIINSFPLLLVYPANITFDRYDQYAYYDVYNERNKKASKPLSDHPLFKSKIMSRKEHELMNYRAINRIYQEIDDQQQINIKQKTDSKKEPVHYDSY